MKTLTNKERLAVSKVFKRALNHLSDTYVDLESGNYSGKRMYLCWAIIEATTPGGMNGLGDTSRAGKLAKNIVQSRLDGCMTLQTWLIRKSLDFAYQVRQDAMMNNGRDMQAHRRAWLMQLIAEFEAPA